jgi:oligopeptide/dipeptide ABC transporter ATP-binding protein
LSQVQLSSNSGESGNKEVIDISHLKVYFSKSQGFFRRTRTIVRAVDDVSFKIYESEIMSLVGESGSGKTTIARCIAGLQFPTHGSIKFREKNEVSKLGGRSLQDYHRAVQMIFQDPYSSLNPRRSVFTTISIPLRRLNREKEKSRVIQHVKDLLIEVGLDPNATMNKLPHQLSGGERQRVNIARALASNPSLLIADEPTSMLDASQRLNMLLLLEKLRQTRNLAVLLITHDLASAKIIGGRTAIMYLGKLVEVGVTKLLLSKPHHPYTELLLATSPRIDLSPKRYEENIPSFVESDLLKGCLFRSRCPYATEICEREEPMLLEKSPDDSAACHNPINL